MVTRAAARHARTVPAVPGAALVAVEVVVPGAVLVAVEVGEVVEVEVAGVEVAGVVAVLAGVVAGANAKIQNGDQAQE